MLKLSKNLLLLLIKAFFWYLDHCLDARYFDFCFRRFARVNVMGSQTEANAFYQIINYMFMLVTTKVFGGFTDVYRILCLSPALTHGILFLWL